VYQLRHTAGLNPKAFQARYTRAGPTYGAGFTAVKPLKPLDNWLLQVSTGPKPLGLGGCQLVFLAHCQSAIRQLDCCLLSGWAFVCSWWCCCSSLSPVASPPVCQIMVFAVIAA
jgi:hypothetical protein